MGLAHPVPGHPEVFVTGDICALQQDGAPLPGVARWRNNKACAPRREWAINVHL